MGLFILIILSISYVVLFGSPTMADKIDVFAGGAGEDFENENFFEKDFLRFKDGLTQRGWTVDMLFYGNKFKVPGAERATNANIDSQLANILKTAKKRDE